MLLFGAQEEGTGWSSREGYSGERLAVRGRAPRVLWDRALLVSAPGSLPGMELKPLVLTGHQQPQLLDQTPPAATLPSCSLRTALSH